MVNYEWWMENGEWRIENWKLKKHKIKGINRELRITNYVLYRRDWFNLFGDVLSEGSMSLKGVSNLFETKESYVGAYHDLA